MRIQADANFAALIESTDDLIWSVDPSYRLITFNHALKENIERIFGVAVAAGVGLREVLPPARAAMWPPLFDRALCGEKFRTEVVFFDGRMMDLSFNPIMVDGAIIGVSVFGKDITERKKAEESSRLFAAIVESSEDAYFAFSPAGNILSWNRGAEAIYGYSADEMIGRPLSIIVAPERREALAQHTEKVLRGQADHREGRGIRKDGRRIHVSVTSWPMRNPAGEVTAISSIIRDVSLRDEADETRALLASICGILGGRRSRLESGWDGGQLESGC